MFIQVHKWMLRYWQRNYEAAIIFAVIHQFTETGKGFFAGYKALADITSIPKARCRATVATLRDISGAIDESHESYGGKTRIIWRSKPSFCDQFSQ